MTRTNLKLVISRKEGPSDNFLKLTRNPDLRPPVRFEPTTKNPQDIVI